MKKIEIIYNHLFKLAAVVACALFLPACSSDDEAADDNAAWGKTSYLTLTIHPTANQAATRSNPNGGEEGDGREEGINQENQVNNITLFLFEEPTGQGVNALPTTEVHSFYIPTVVAAGNLYTTGILKFEEYELTANTYAVVVANAGNLTSAGITTLGGLQSYLYKQLAFTPHTDMAHYRNFVMSSANDSKVTLTSGGVVLGDNYSTPATLEVTIERLAARIDIVPNQPFTNNYYEYSITSSLDKVRITHITPINTWNAPQEGSYLLKRVIDEALTQTTYLGHETVRPSTTYANNYVLTPHFEAKTASYWRNHSETVKSWYNNHLAEARSSIAVTAPTNSDGTDGYYILDYAHENCFKAESQLKTFATGVMLQGTYIPQTVYDDTQSPIAYTPGTTFWVKDDIVYNYAIPGGTQYTDGICYYYYYLRHSNDNLAGANGVMEFGVVRNNIYRLIINSFSGIGGGTDTPEEEIDQLTIQIKVIPWDLRVHDVIYM